MSEKGYIAFCDFIRGKSCSLIGIGVSNLPLVSFLLSAGASKVSVRDLKKEESSFEIQKAKQDGASLFLGGDYLEGLNEDIIIRSPAVRPDIVPFVHAMNNGSILTCETELFLRFAPCKTIAVTGSDGKTTTTTLISKILEEAGWNVFLGGNIGKAMLPQLKNITDKNSIGVMELSSFQLMHCNYSPSVAVITNLAENHLDWHIDMAEYLDAKKNIYRYQDETGVLVVNLDNQHTKICRGNGNTRFFSYNSNVQCGTFFSNGSIFLSKNSETETILDTKDIILPGRHNIENYLAAIAATADFVDRGSVHKIATSFGGVEHRIELVRELDGVKFYNSSIDSSPSRSTAALRAFQDKVIMIAGGYDKNLDYTPLGDVICEHVKILILCGATSEKIEDATERSTMFSKDHPIIIQCDHFEDTITTARKLAVRGDVIILSPASASFDLFKNFDERGKYFKKLVMELS